MRTAAKRRRVVVGAAWAVAVLGTVGALGAFAGMAWGAARVARAAPADTGAAPQAGGRMTEAAVPGEWLTPAEAAGFEATPDYEETMAFLRRLRRPAARRCGSRASAAPPPAGRLPLVIVSRERAFTPAAAPPPRQARRADPERHPSRRDRRQGRLPDDPARPRARPAARSCSTTPPCSSCRSTTSTATSGSRRTTARTRTGRIAAWASAPPPPASTSTATTSRSSRPRRRRWSGWSAAWRPHLFVDNHVTDGVDHDWVLTWSWAEAPQLPAPVDAWMRTHLPAALAATERAGHATGPYVDLKDGTDPAQGLQLVGRRAAVLERLLPAAQPRRRCWSRRCPTSPTPSASWPPATSCWRCSPRSGATPPACTGAVAAAEAATVAAGAPHAAASADGGQLRGEPGRRPHPAAALRHRDLRNVAGDRPPAAALPARRGARPLEVPWYHGSRATLTLPRPRGYLVMPGWPQIEQRLRVQGLRVRAARRAGRDRGRSRCARPSPSRRATYQGLTTPAPR